MNFLKFLSNILSFYENIKINSQYKDKMVKSFTTTFLRYHVNVWSGAKYSFWVGLKVRSYFNMKSRGKVTA